ncbi:hypothetical protein EDB84DRAFT_1447668, partial [Lactarius hengduanensis]
MEVDDGGKEACTTIPAAPAEPRSLPKARPIVPNKARDVQPRGSGTHVATPCGCTQSVGTVLQNPVLSAGPSAGPANAPHGDCHPPSTQSPGHRRLGSQVQRTQESPGPSLGDTDKGIVRGNPGVDWSYPYPYPGKTRTRDWRARVFPGFTCGFLGGTLLVAIVITVGHWHLRFFVVAVALLLPLCCCRRRRHVPSLLSSSAACHVVVVVADSPKDSPVVATA